VSAVRKTNGTTPSARLWRITVPAFAVPYFFHVGQSKTSRPSPLWMFIATALPLDEPTTTSGWYFSASAWAI
jgi:hypothetical protein